jgi:hypothetical protein
LKTGDARISVSLKESNKVISHHRNSFSCSPLFFNTLVDTLLQLKSPATVQKEKMLVLWITKYQLQQINDDSIRLINEFLYSNKATISIALSIMEICNHLRCNDNNKDFFCTSTDLSTALMASIISFKNNQNICYHGCELIYYLNERNKVVDAGMLEALVKVKEAHVSDQRINGLICSILKRYLKKNLFSVPFDPPEYSFTLRAIVVIPYFLL